jgi:hypothetical protein
MTENSVEVSRVISLEASHFEITPMQSHSRPPRFWTAVLFALIPGVQKRPVLYIYMKFSSAPFVIDKMNVNV